MPTENNVEEALVRVDRLETFKVPAVSILVVMVVTAETTDTTKNTATMIDNEKAILFCFKLKKIFMIEIFI